jgi:hypothetical protein
MIYGRVQYRVQSPQEPYQVTEEGWTDAYPLSSPEVALDLARRAERGSRIKLWEKDLIRPGRVWAWRYLVVSTEWPSVIRATPEWVPVSEGA